MTERRSSPNGHITAGSRTMRLAEFLDQLAASGVLSNEEFRALQSQVPMDAYEQEDAKDYACELVRLHKLTAYQATMIYQGQSQQLVFGNYVVLDKLGQGGMGAVYKARHRRMERVVALKIVAPAIVSHPESLKRFRREVVAAARFHHQNIVAAIDADEQRGVHFLVMEFVDGADLATTVRRHGPLSVPQALDCIIQSARGLEFAHRAGVVHRDVKPHNLLLDSSHTVKILDLGLARIDDLPSEASATESLTQSGAFMGTADYMSPEQALDSKHVDQRADVYSLGISLWYLLTGRVCYPGDSVIKKILAHREQPIPSLVTVRDDVPAALDLAFQKMVAKNAEDRPQSMTEVIELLTPIASSTPLTEAVPTFPTAPDECDPISFLRNVDRDADSTRLEGQPTIPTTVTARPTANPAPDDGVTVLETRPQARTARLLGVATILTAFVATAIYVSDRRPEQRPNHISVNQPTTAQSVPAVDAQIEVPVQQTTADVVEPTEVWEPLFNGRDLEGWEVTPELEQGWTVQDGNLVRVEGPYGPHFYHTRRLSDFVVRLESKSESANSGIELRQSNVQVEISDPQATGTIVIYGAKSIPPVITDVWKPGEWNQWEITCRGLEYTIRLNGKEVNHWNGENDPDVSGMIYYGPVILETGIGRIEFRKIEVRELNPPEPQTKPE